MSKHTPLYDEHVAAGAKMVDFHGWALPINYGSQIQEHQAVRNDAGMFDVSHMTIIDLLGAGGRQFLRYLLANDIDRLQHPGQALYSCMLNEHGGVIDDLIAYERGVDNYRLVFNSATRERTLAWLRQQANDVNVNIYERPELAMIAIQGPNAIAKTATILDATQMDALSTLQKFESAEIQDCFIARTGYTGEDGIEFMGPKQQVVELWQHLIQQQVQPCGLGARDTLRLEAGMHLSGQDMDETTTPLESGLNFTLAWIPEDRDFIGRQALALQKERGVERKLVGLVLKKAGIMRAGYKVILPEGNTGVITSGTFSPTLEESIALARVPVAIETTCQVEIRGKLIDAEVIKPRFLKRRHHNTSS